MQKASKIAMIPARLNSKRVPKKNLRLINDQPLVSYIIKAAIASSAFDRIYINSESEIFREIADDHGVEFYKRPENLSLDSTVNDEFAYDFIKKIGGDYLFQLLPTSPLIEPNQIFSFVEKMINQDLETLISVVPHQIASIYKKSGINFSPMEAHISSQEMTPVYSYATVLMGWQTSSFIERMQKFGFAYHGGDGKTDYFPICGLATIDVDNEEDFQLAEVALAMKHKIKNNTPTYYEPLKAKFHSEVNVPEILKKDGISNVNFDEENKPVCNITQLVEAKGAGSWCHRLVNTESNSATLISQMPSEGNRMHYHPDWNEWWYIIKGTWKWILKDKTLEVKQGDLVFIPKGVSHRIEATGTGPAIRIAVSRADVEHIYPETDKSL